MMVITVIALFFMTAVVGLVAVLILGAFIFRARSAPLPPPDDLKKRIFGIDEEPAILRKHRTLSRKEVEAECAAAGTEPPPLGVPVCAPTPLNERKRE